MIKYFCDRCGDEIGNFNRFTVTVEPPEARMLVNLAKTETYILCYDCVKELNKWIERRAKKL